MDCFTSGEVIIVAIISAIVGCLIGTVFGYGLGKEKGSNDLKESINRLGTERQVGLSMDEFNDRYGKEKRTNGKQ